MTRIATLLLGLAAASAEACEPSEQPLEFDPERSRAEFEVNVLLLFKLGGHFERFQAELLTDDQGGLRVRACIEADSVAMERKDYADWLRSAEFFDVGRFPAVLFESEPFTADLVKTGGEIDGRLTLRGQTRPQRLQIEPLACDGEPCGLRAQGSLRRREFGMTARRAVSDRVRLRFELVTATEAQ